MSNPVARIDQTKESELELYWGDVPLFSYVFRPDVPRTECPKPYFHPIRNLEGNVISNFRPNDHPWHHGLSMTMTLVNGSNFWGGNTYKKEDGYKLRDNIGIQLHKDWEKVSVDETGAEFVESVDWNDEKDKTLLVEERIIRARIYPESNAWKLGLVCSFKNTSAQTLRLGTYESEEGLKGSHYTGIFFRMARDFLAVGEWKPIGGFLPGGEYGEKEVHGATAPWMGCVGSFDDSDVRTTLIACDHAKNPNYPVRWFFRPGMPCLAMPFVGEGAQVLAANEHMVLRYEFIIASGALNIGECEALVSSL